jgi:hypothetical protein
MYYFAPPVHPNKQLDPNDPCPPNWWAILRTDIFRLTMGKGSDLAQRVYDWERRERARHRKILVAKLKKGGPHAA